MYFDAHTHLNDDTLYPQRKTHLDTFIAQGWGGLICVGVDPVWNSRAIEIAATHTTSCLVKAVVGLHPSEVISGTLSTDVAIDSAIDDLRILIGSHTDAVAAIGECGIDYHYPTSHDKRDLQAYLFERQCLLARELSLPIVIHSRDAFGDTYAILQRYTDLQIYFHCRSYETPALENVLDTFPHLWIGRCGNITYPKAEPLRQTLTTFLHHTRRYDGSVGCLIETDAPWLTPVPRRWSTNTPAYITATYDQVSLLSGLPLEKLQSRVAKDWKDLFLWIDFKK